MERPQEPLYGIHAIAALVNPFTSWDHAVSGKNLPLSGPDVMQPRLPSDLRLWRKLSQQAFQSLLQLILPAQLKILQGNARGAAAPE